MVNKKSNRKSLRKSNRKSLRKSNRKSLRKSNRKSLIKKGGVWNGSIFTNRGNSCYVDSLLFPLFYFKMQYPETLLSTQITDRILAFNDVSYKYNNVLIEIQKKWNEFNNKKDSILTVCNDVMIEYAKIERGNVTEQRDSLEFFLNTFQFISNLNIFNIITEHKICYQRIKGSLNDNRISLEVIPIDRYFDIKKNINEKFVKIEINNKKYNVLNNLQDCINTYVKEIEQVELADYQFRKIGDSYNLNGYGFPIRDKNPTNHYASNNTEYPYSIITKDTKTRNFDNTQILIIQLVREFLQGENINNKQINIPTTLIIGKYEFILRFATIKIGGIGGGHWMAMINKPEEGLMFYNDIGPSFEKANTDNINLLNTKGFHFFYEKTNIDELSRQMNSLSLGRHPLTFTIGKKSKRLEELRKAAEAKRLEELRKAAEAKRLEELRKAAEARKAEEERLTREFLEKEKRAAEARKAEEERLTRELLKEEEKKLRRENRIKKTNQSLRIEKEIQSNINKILENKDNNLDNEEFQEIENIIKKIKNNPNLLIDDLVPKENKKFRQILTKIGYSFITGGKRNKKLKKKML